MEKKRGSCLHTPAAKYPDRKKRRSYPGQNSKGEKKVSPKREGKKEKLKIFPESRE